jgi:hypothetical protein
MIKNNLAPFSIKVKNYVGQNWGSPFIVGFMALLLSVAFSISLGLYSLADSIAVYSYYSLVMGVLLQLACFLKYRRNENNVGVFDESS